MKRFLEAGKIVNTHGVRGDVKLQPWASSPEFLCGFDVLYIDDKPVKVLSSRVQKGCVILSLDGVCDIDGASRLRNKIVFIDRQDAHLDPGEHFIQDLIGLKAIDHDTGTELGKISDVISLPANDVYAISGEREMLIPAVPDFVREINIEGGWISFHVIEGM